MNLFSLEPFVEPEKVLALGLRTLEYSYPNSSQVQIFSNAGINLNDDILVLAIFIQENLG